MNREQFDKDGFIVLKNAIPEDILQKYEDLWIKTHTSGFNENNELIINSPNGWNNSSSYLDHKEILDILCHENIFNFLKTINAELALHLSFTGWTSTLKSWHHDWTTPDKSSAANYIGAWVALDEIHPDSGPFQFIPGSHLWDLDYEKIYKKENHAQVQDIIFMECVDRSAQAFSFLGNRGDVILWSGHLIHRGAVPNNMALLRKSVIGHYGIMASNITKYGAGFYHSDRLSGIDLYQ